MSKSELIYAGMDTEDRTIPFDPAEVYVCQWSQLQAPEVWQSSAANPKAWRELTDVERAMFDVYRQRGGDYRRLLIDGP
jgi:hypothetical protein